MLLILTNSQDATADYLAPILDCNGVAFCRFNTDTCISDAAIFLRSGQVGLQLAGRTFLPADFSHVWYRRPERLKSATFDDTPEGKYARDEWAEALEGFLSHIPKARWLNHPAANSLASHKLEQLSTARALGLSVPRTLVTQDASELHRFFSECDGRVIVKPMGSGYIERSMDESDSQIYTTQVTADNLRDLDDLAHCPTLFQMFIQKSSDVRVTMVDNDCHAVELIARDSDGSQRCDVRRYNMADVEYRPVALPSGIEAGVRTLMKNYELRFAAIDFVVGNDGEWYFLEVNPNGQWAWLDLSGGFNIAASFVKSFGEVLAK